LSTFWSRPLGIGGRLGVAFGLSAILAVTAALVGFFSYERLSLSMRQISERDLPAATASAEIAQIAGSITAAAPLLAQVTSNEQVEQTAQKLTAQLTELRRVLTGPAPVRSSEMVTIVDRLALNLEAIRRQTVQAVVLRQDNDRQLREVRGLHSDFVEEVEPLIEDARFIIQSTLERLESGAVEPREGVKEIRQRVRGAEAILQAASHANLAVGLLSRIASVAEIEQLAVDDHFLAETIELIRAQLAGVEDAADTVTVRQMLFRLFELAGADGLPGLRRQQLALHQLTTDLLTENRALIRDLDQQVGRIVDVASEQAAASGQAAARSITTGRNLLALIAVLAILAAALMAVLYVRGSLIARIRSLAESARMLAEGRVPPPIEARGTDELADMARAIEGFRRTQNDLVQSAKLAALGHLSAGIAHELNQPLNAIRSQAHNALVLLERGDASGADSALKKVQDLTSRAGLVVNQLRRFARRSELTLKPVSMREAINGASLILASRLKETGVRLKVQMKHDHIAEADEIRLQQVFVNLIGNAIDAISGRSDPRINVACEQRNNVIRITVADNGPGLADEVAASLFDPFVTTKPPGEGVGLGLTISYNLVRDFGGALSAQSSAEGASFIIELRAALEMTQ
jgi:two-component system, NtrC family, C4-dicarboxylate transport sensor histidine kinase DctB